MAMKADGSVVFLSFMARTPLLSNILILGAWNDNELTSDLLIHPLMIKSIIPKK